MQDCQPETAQQAYNDFKSEALTLMAQLTEKIEQGPDGDVNWAHVGDMSFIVEALRRTDIGYNG